MNWQNLKETKFVLLFIILTLFNSTTFHQTETALRDRVDELCAELEEQREAVKELQFELDNVNVQLSTNNRQRDFLKSEVEKYVELYNNASKELRV